MSIPHDVQPSQTAPDMPYGPARSPGPAPTSYGPRAPYEPDASYVPGSHPPESPRLGDGETAAYGPLPAPAPHTGAELVALLDLLARERPTVRAVTVGHSRDAASRDAARAFTDAWQTAGGTVLDVVNWPETAASWLRAAGRLTTQEPDAWVVAAALPGFAQLARRLRHSTNWDPARTVAFAALRDSRLPALAGRGVLDGLCGAGADGDTWEVRRGWVTSRPAEGTST